MSEIKTVTHQGQVLKISKLYAFSNDHKHNCERRLKSVDKSNTKYPFDDHAGVSWRYIKAIDSSELGTITPAPIELVDGAAYMFDYEGRKVDRIGIYLKHDNHFVFPIGSIHTTNCTNIRLMTVESK
jgi:hypothetical protein